MAKSSNKWLERYTDGGLYIPLEGTSYVVRQQISKPRTYEDGGLGDGDDPKKPKPVIYTDYNKYLKANQAYGDSLNLYNLSNELVRGKFGYPKNYKFSSNPKYWEDYKIKFKEVDKDGMFRNTLRSGLQELGVNEYRKEVLKSLKRKIKPLGYMYTDFAIPVYKKPITKPEYKNPNNQSFMLPGVLSYDKKEMTPFNEEEDLNFSDYTETINNLKENKSEIKKSNTQIKNNNSNTFKNKIKKLKREFFPGYRLPYQYQYANGGLGDGDPKPVLPKNFVPIKWDAKTQKENELLQKSINERTKNTPEFRQTRKLTKEEQDYSDKVKARIENPAADLGILTANMASALTRLQYLTPEEIKKITNNPKATTELAADIMTQGLANELIGGAITAAPQFIKNTAKALGTESGLLSKAYKLNPKAFNSELEKKIIKENLPVRQIYGDEAFQSFKQYGPSVQPGISQNKQLLDFAKLKPESVLNAGTGETMEIASTSRNYPFPYFSQGSEWYRPIHKMSGTERLIVPKTGSNLTFYPAGEQSIVMNFNKLSPETINSYAGKRRVLAPFQGFDNPANFDVYETAPHWWKGKVYRPIETPSVGKHFKSEIDWSKWNPETPNYPELINEYNAIEESTKKNGTWMKNSDGSPFQGTPEQFVQQQSSWFKKAFPKGFENVYRGDMTADRLKTGNIGNNKAIFTGDIETGKHYAGNKGSLFELIHPKSENSIEFNNLGRSWRNISRSHFGENPPNLDVLSNRLNTPQIGNYTSTDDIAKWIEKNNKDYVNIKNIFDGTDANFVKIVNHKPGNYLKSAVGNVGFFDMTNPNIYKSLLPIGIATGAATQQKKYGGWLNQYEQGGYPDDTAVLDTQGQEVNTMQFALPTVPTFNLGNGDGDGDDPKAKKKPKPKDKKTDTRTIGQKRHDALEDAKAKILKTESPENRKKMDMLYSTTIAAENTYGYDSRAYGRKKQTRSPMSIDNIALDELFNPKGQNNRYTLQQKLNFDMLRGLGLPTDRAKLKELLETDDAYAGLGTAKTLYFNEGVLGNLPNPTDTTAYINLYLNEYNKKGALKHQEKNELVNNITNKMRGENNRKTKTIKPTIKNKTTKPATKNKTTK